MVSREEALKILKKHIQNENLIKHCLAVEAGMRSYAKKLRQCPDESEIADLWGITGLMHDIDYEELPEDHPSEEGHKILKEAGLPEESLYAIMAHGNNEKEYPRRSLLDKALFAVDEMAGFIIAVALVRPAKLDGMKVKSVKKKLKDKAFAKGVDREAAKRGAQELGVELSDHIQLMIEALQGIKDDLGL